MKEQSIQSKIIKYLNTKGYVIKVIEGSRSGIPDIIASIGGRFYAFEVKRSEKEQPSELQNLNINKIKESGGEAYVVHSLDQVKEILE